MMLGLHMIRIIASHTDSAHQAANLNISSDIFVWSNHPEQAKE